MTDTLTRDELLTSSSLIRGAGGGGKKGGSGKAPVEAPNTLRSKNIAKILELISEGPIKGLVDGAKSVVVNSGATDATPLMDADGKWNYDGATLDYRLGDPSQEPIPGFDDQTETSPVGVTVENGGDPTGNAVVRRITNLNADAVRVIIQLQALLKVDVKTGDQNGYAVEYAIDVKSAADAGGTYVEKVHDRISGKTTSPWQKAYRIALDGPGPWDIRVRRISADDSSTTTQSTMAWAAYSVITEYKLMYPHSALVALTVDTSQFGTSIPRRGYEVEGMIVEVPSNYDAVNRTYDGIWDGTFTTAYTNNPAWCLRDLLVNNRYGLGDIFKAARLNLGKWDLYACAKYADAFNARPNGTTDDYHPVTGKHGVPDGLGGFEPRFTFNAVLNTRMRAYEALLGIAGMMRTIMMWAQGELRFVQDRPASSVKNFSPANVIDGVFNYTGTALRARHTAIRVTFINAAKGYATDDVLLEDPEGIRRYGYNLKEETAYGCTSYGQALRHARNVLITEAEETDTVQFRIGDGEAGMLPGQIMAISDPIMTEREWAGRLKASSANGVTFDRVLHFDPARTYIVTVLSASGYPIDKALVNPGEPSNQAVFVTPITADDLPDFPEEGPAQEPWVLADALPVPNAMYAVSSDVLTPRKFRLIVMGEEGGGKYKVAGLQYAEGKHDAIDLQFSLPNQPIADLPPAGVVQPPSGLVLNYATVRTATGAQGVLEIDWEPSADPYLDGYWVEYQYGEDNWVRLPKLYETHITLSNPKMQIVRVRVMAASQSGRSSRPITQDLDLSTGTSNGKDLVSGLQLVGGGTEWKGLDVHLQWQAKPIYGDASLMTNGADPYFRRFRIRVRNAQTEAILNTYYSETPDFLYPQERMIADGLRRDYRISVSVEDINGTFSNEQTVTFQNQAPAAPVGLQAQADLDAIDVRWTASTDPDYAGTQVHLGTTPDFVPGPATLKVDGPGGQARLPLPEAGTYYVKIGHYDQFSSTPVSWATAPAVNITGLISEQVASQGAAIEDLWATYGDTASANAAAAAAELAAGTAAAAASNAAAAQGLAEDALAGAQNARADAIEARDEAAGSASAAASSASGASASATLAGEHASAASADRVLAQTARGQAETYSTNAATSASDAAGSASAAASSATVSASTAAATFPATMENGIKFFTPSINGARTPGDLATGWTSGVDASGPFLRIVDSGATVGYGYYHVGTMAVRAAIPGRRYRGTLVLRRHGGTGSAYAAAAFYGLTADRSEILYAGFGTAHSSGVPSSIEPVTASYAKIGYEIEIVADPTAAFISWAPYIRVDPGGVLGAADILECRFEDVTSEVLAAASASASAQSASQAAASETAAGQSASAAQSDRVLAETARGQAQTAASNAATSESNAAGSASSASASSVVAANARAAVIAVTRNPYFDQGLDGWEHYGAMTVVGTAGGRASVVQTAAGYNSTLTSSPVTIPGGSPRFRLRIGHRQIAGPETTYYCGLFFYDADGSLIGGTDGTGNYPLGPSYTLPVDGTWVDREVVVGVGYNGPSPYGGTVSIPGSAKTFRLVLYYNYANQLGVVVQLDQFSATDVTSEIDAYGYASAAAQSASTAAASETAAGQSASSASTQANNASTYAGQASASRDQAAASASSAAGSASSASASATLAASVASSSMLGNSRFSDWSALTGAGAPAPWGTADGYMIGGSTISQGVGEQAGTSGLKLTMPAGSSGTVQNYWAQITGVGTVTPGSWYVAEADVRLDAGSLLGSGVYVTTTTEDASGLSAEIIEFYSDPSNNTNVPVAHGQVGRVYRYAKLFQVTMDAQASRFRVYAMGRWTGFAQGVSEAAAQLTFLKLAVRPASADEIEQRAARGGFSSLSAKIADVSAVAASATAALATRTTTLEAVTTRNHNMLRNSTSADGMTYWESLGSIPFYANVDLTMGPWFNARFDNQPAVNATLRSQPFTGGYGGTYTMSGKGFLSGLATGYAYVGVYGYTNEAGNTGEVALCNYNMRDQGNPGWLTIPAMTFSTPSNVVTFRVWVQVVGTNNGGYGHVGVFQLKVEPGNVATGWTDEATDRNGLARVTETASALTTLEGRVEATAGLTVQAGNRIAGMRFHAVDGTDTNYSSIQFLADVLQVWDSVNSTGVAPFEIRNGGVRARAAMIDRLSVTVKLTLGSGIPWAVAVQPLDISVTDGQVVSFGYDLGNNPALTFVGNNLAPLNTGETYNLYADSLSPTGFIARLKINTPGTPANVALGPTSGSPSGPTSHHFALGAVSSTGSYDIRVNGAIRSYFYNASPNADVAQVEDGSYSDGELHIAVYGYNGSSWTQIGTIYVSPALRNGGGWSAGGSPTGYYDDSFDITQSFAASSNITHIGVGVSYETYSQSYIGNLWINFQSPGTAGGVRSATPNGQLSTVTVRPRT